MATIDCCEQELQPRSALVGSLSVNDPQLVKTGVTYTFQFTISQYVSLQTDDMVYIYFPYQYKIPTGSIFCTVETLPVDASAVTSNPVCEARAIGTSSTTTFIRVSSFLQSNQPAGSSTTFVIALSSLTNPSEDPSSTPFSVSLVTSGE